MTRKLFYIFLTMLAWTVSTILVQSCNDMLVSEGQINSVCFTGLNPSNDNSPDEFLNDIGFVVMGFRENSTCNRPSGFGLISSCYATTKCTKWQNDFIISSFQLKFDKQVIIAGDTISPNTDLFQNSIFRDNTAINKDEDDCKYITMKIILSPNLVSQITFDQGIYTVSFDCSTSDSKTFSKQRQVIFK